MATKAWTTNYPTSQDSTPVTTEQPTLVDTEDITQVSHIHTMRDKLDAVCKKVGDDSNLPAGCILSDVSKLQTAAGGWVQMSTTQPSGVSAAPSVLYYFDDTTTSAYDDQSGNSVDLSVSGGDADRRFCAYGGNIVYVCDQRIESNSNYLSAAANSNFQTTGAVCIEMVYCWTREPSSVDALLFGVYGGGESSADNYLYSIYWSDVGGAGAGKAYYFAEVGSGTNQQHDFALWRPTLGNYHHLLFTRDTSSPANHDLYIDGQNVESWTQNAPSGGGNSLFYMGVDANINIMGFKLTKEYFDSTDAADAYALVRNTA